MVEETRYVHGTKKLAKRIATLRKNLSLPPLMDEIGGLLHKRTLERFDRQVTPTYGAWAALAPSTLRRKAALGYGDKPSLVRTGAMRKAIQVIRGRADGGTFVNTGAGVRIGIVDPDIAKYATVQNNGNDRITGRRFLGIAALDVKAVDSLLRRKAKQIERTL